MSSKPCVVPLEIDLRPSRWLLGGEGLLHCGALLAPWFSALPRAVAGLVTLAVALAWARALWRQLGAQRVVALGHDAGGWWLRAASGRRWQGQLGRGALALEGLVIVPLRQGRLGHRRVLVLADSAEAEARRRLRLRVREESGR